MYGNRLLENDSMAKQFNEFLNRPMSYDTSEDKLGGITLAKKVRGHYTYYGINGNHKSLVQFYKYVKYTWFRVLRKRGQKHKIKYKDFLRIWKYLEIPEPKIYVNIWEEDYMKSRM